MLKIHLFGHLRALVDDEPLAPPGRSHVERLWAYLLLHRGRPLDRGDLAAVLWPDEADPRTALRLHLHYLKKHLPSHPAGRSWLEAKRSTVAWTDEADCWLDVAEFEALCDRLDEDGSDPGTLDRAALEKAAALYAGPLLEGLDEPWADERRDQLARRYAALLEHLAAVRADDGDVPGAIGASRRLLACDPWREETVRLVMRLHARAGDRAAALGEYSEYRSRAAAELGVEPMLETVELAAEIRDHVPDEDDGAEPGPEPATIADPAQATAPKLPSPAGRLVGAARKRPIVEALAEARLITVTGPPGCGKSRLALEAARAARDDFPGGVWWVDLAGVVAIPGRLVEAVADTVGGAPTPESLVGRLADRPSLLVLDNCEHVVDECVELVDGLLAALGPRVLVTSREWLAIEGEERRVVPLLTVPERGAPANPKRPTEAVRLFLDRAGLDGARLEPEELAAVAEICRRLDGLPLAVECAAACVSRLAVTDIAARLDDCLPLLDAADPGPASAWRHVTLTAALESSCRSLVPIEAALLRRLAVFPGPFSTEDAEKVCAGRLRGGVDVPRDEIIDLMARLVAKSLVLPDVNAPGFARQRLLEVTRQYGRANLAAIGELEEARRRHAA